MTQKYKSRHKGSEIDNAVDKVESLATVATTGSYNDLTDKPDIPSGGGSADITVDESLSTTSINPVQNKVITAELNKKGTYSKPSDGIPKSDLASDVQESLGKADTALQTYEEQYKGTVTSVKINGSTKNPDADGLVDLGNIVGDGEGGSVIIDAALSDTSTNPVQNKVIAEALNQKFDKTGGEVKGNVTATKFIGNLDGSANSAKAIKGSNSGVNLFDHLIAHDAENWAIYRGGEVIFRVATAGLVIGPYDKTSGFIALRTGDNYDYSGNREVRLLSNGNLGVGNIAPEHKLHVNGNIKANDYLDAYGISLYETFATKTELGDINAVLDAINGEVI